MGRVGKTWEGGGRVTGAWDGMEGGGDTTEKRNKIVMSVSKLPGSTLTIHSFPFSMNEADNQIWA